MLAMADLVVAAEDAKFGHPAGRDLGIPVTLSFWPILIGMRKTKDCDGTSGKLRTEKRAAKKKQWKIVGVRTRMRACSFRKPEASEQ